MTICDLKKGERAIVLKADCPAPVRERLRFLGIYTGAKLLLLKTSLLKKTYLVQACGATSALGRETASCVYVWRLDGGKA